MSEVEDEVRPEAKPQLPLDRRRCSLEQHVRQTWMVTLSEATPRDAIFEPSFWRHTAGPMHPMDKICITDDSGTYYREVIVTGVDREKLFVHQIYEANLVKPPQHSDADLSIVWAGPHRRWEVLRGDKILGTGHASRDAAERTLAGFAGARG